jgi:hypothetical protein
MKTFLTIFITIIIFGKIFSQTEESVITGASYVNEVYYSFNKGSIKTAARTDWDIAFTTNVFDISILANTGVTGCELYTYPKGKIDDWESVDTTGMKWKPMYNSLDSWEEGAFTMNALGHPDYGWGIYNMGTHEIIGDSIFIIKLSTGDYKKLAIVKKISTQNQWIFKYENLDNTNLVEVTFDADDYPNRNFIHYSLNTEAFIEQEPTDYWQLLFTKYYDYTIPYYVTGILSDPNVLVQQVDDVDQATFETYDNELFNDSVINEIGSDWKTFNGTSYDLDNDRVYFVHDTTDIHSFWKLYFTGFSGSSTGTYTFMKENLGYTGISEIEAVSTIYPNPTKDNINLIYAIDGKTNISIYDITGKLVFSTQVNYNNGLNKHLIKVENFASGIYNVVMQSDHKRSSVRFVKQ